MRHAKKKSRKKYLWLISLVIAAICFFVWKNNFNSNRMPANYHADQVDLNVKAAVAIMQKMDQPFTLKMLIKACRLPQ